MSAPSTTPTLFWMPGCSACLRAKEFIERTGQPYEAINLDERPEYGAKLRDHSLELPAVCLGDHCVSGLDLAAVAELLGVAYDEHVPLPPKELYIRYETILNGLIRYLRQMPAEGLGFRLPNRERPMLEVCNQAATIIRAFLSAYYLDHYDETVYVLPDDVRTTSDLVVRAQATWSMMSDWWDQDGQDDPLDRVTGTHWGHRTLLEILERDVWHTAQHTRQIIYVLEQLGIAPDGPLTEAHLAGLPLPDRIHA